MSRRKSTPMDAKFHQGDQVRVKHGVIDEEFP